MGLKFQTLGNGSHVMLCLHGFLGEGSDWANFAEAFLSHTPDWSLVLVDLPGHCEEEAGWNCPAVDEFSRSLRTLVEDQGWGSAVLAGYSLGGRLGLNAVLSFPEVFPIFIGLSTMAGIEDGAERARRRDTDAALASCLRSGNDFTAFLREWWHQPVFASPARDGGSLEKFVASRQLRDPVCMAACLETWSAGSLPSQWSALASYPGRVLLLTGEADSKFAFAAARMQTGFRDAEHRAIAGAGHQLLVEKAEETALAVASFLKDRS